MKRRDFIKWSLASAALMATGPANALSTATSTATNGQRFIRELPIPPLLEKTMRVDGGSGPGLFELKAMVGSKSFFPDIATETLGYNGSFLGPTIRVRNGDNVSLAVTNSLDEVTTVHWHGLHVPARWDGGPHQVIGPDEVWRPKFTINQQAATLWYHPHAMGLTGKHVYQGLAGLFIIDDEISDALPLPSTYGVDDVPLILQDRRFYDDGSFAYVRSMHDVIHGVLGNILLVNGSSAPFMEVGRGIIRFRLLNGSNSSIYRLRTDTPVPLKVIASDGGLLHRPVTVKDLVLSAGERIELLADFSDLDPGERIRFWVDQFGGMSFEALELRIGQGRTEFSTIPEILREQPRIPETEADTTRQFAMETMSQRGMGMAGGNRLTINGMKMDISRIDHRIELGSTEIWEITNTSASMMQLPHSMHLHDVQFNILDRNGQPPAPVEAGRKDTVLLWPGDRVRIIARFQDYTGIYMYHCHLLEHEDDGMMGQFEVYSPGVKT